MHDTPRKGLRATTQRVEQQREDTWHGSSTTEILPDQYAPYQIALDRLAPSVEHGRMPERLDQDPHAASVAFGVRLRELRAEHGLSQDDLANRTDVHPTAIGRLERGSREPRLTTILRIARGLDVQPGALLDELGGA
jgi:DNA-binding XRE family transcriptional regulator